MEYITDVNVFIESTEPDQQKILIALRGLIEDTFPEAEELYKWSRPVYACPKQFCYLQSSKKYVTLGFYDATNVEDPENLLEGSGKKMRHIKITSADDVRPALFKKMLFQGLIN